MYDNITIGKNIYRRRKELRLTLTDVSERVGVCPSTITRYEKGVIETPKIPVLEAIAKALDTTPSLLFGEIKNRNIYMADFSEMTTVPIIGRAAAGLSCHAETNNEGYEYVPKKMLLPGEQYVYLKVVGDSMSPVIMEGDLVLVRCQSEVGSGEYAVVLIDDEDGVVKKVIFKSNSITLISENKDYPPRTFVGKEMSRIRIFGKVMESKRKF